MGNLFYDKDRNRYKFQLKEKIGSGGSGEVYKTGKDSCIKIFKYPHNINNKLEEILRIISELDLENMYQIKKILYNDEKDLIGYMMKYYQEEKIDILTMPVEYTIENMIGLYKLANSLGKRNIRTHDLIPINTILTENKIIVIDTDGYFLEDYECANFNKYGINCLLTDLYKKHLSLNHNISNYNPETINNIDNLFQQHNPEIIYKKLSKHKYPIDYIRKN